MIAAAWAAWTVGSAGIGFLLAWSVIPSRASLRGELWRREEEIKRLAAELAVARQDHALAQSIAERACAEVDRLTTRQAQSVALPPGLLRGRFKPRDLRRRPSRRGAL